MLLENKRRFDFELIVFLLDWARFVSMLNTYNCFLKDKPHLQLNVNENSTGQVTLEGFLVVSWGMKRPIRLKIQDEKHSDSSQSPGFSPDPISPLGNKRGMTRWGEFDDLHHIDELEEIIQDGADTLKTCTTDYSEFDSRTLRAPRPKAIIEESSSLFRTRSDASLVTKRVKSKTMEERERDRQHRFSINGHFYNYKIENDPSEFALYCIHQSGEKRKLSSSDLPLWERFLQGPSESIVRIFLMDTDEQEVSMDVAQYLNLELPILQRVLLKLQEEENHEIQRIVSK
ncbi:hypothetical protein NFI96_003946 [Prochilodus magdalenae]|nr:hypothetical protein NFI96_003946 [Prochilodus magdalenae]